MKVTSVVTYTRSILDRLSVMVDFGKNTIDIGKTPNSYISIPLIASYSYAKIAMYVASYCSY